MINRFNKPVVVILTTNQGHWSLSMAMQEELKKRGCSVKIIKKVGFLNRAYTIFYRYFPKLFKYVCKLMSAETITSRLVYFWFFFTNKAIRKNVVALQPDLVVSNYFEHTPNLDNLAKNYFISTLNFMANPATNTDIIELSSLSTNLVFDDFSVKNQCANKYLLIKTGWLVQDKFSVETSIVKLRKYLQLKNVWTLFFISGSLGSPKDLIILKKILSFDLPIQILFSCGDNRQLKRKIETLMESMTFYHTTLQTLGFTQDMHRYMQASDLIVGKAGPNSIFETIACHKPFFATHHIHGQEDANLDIIQRYRLGWVEENPQKAIKKIIDIFRNPQQIQTLKPHIEKMAVYNKKAKEKFGKIAIKLIEESPNSNKS